MTEQNHEEHPPYSRAYVEAMEGKTWSKKQWYHDYYLKSKHWYEVREAQKTADGYMCFICGSQKNLNVHHIDEQAYKHFWHEKVESCCSNDGDLVTLCESCHQKIHAFMEQEEKNRQEDMKEIKDSVAVALRSQYIKYYGRDTLRIARLIKELPIRDQPGASAAVSTLLKRASPVQADLKIVMRGNQYNRTKPIGQITIYGNCAPNIDTAVRILKKRYKKDSVNTIADWKRKWNNCRIYACDSPFNVDEEDQRWNNRIGTGL